MVIVFARKLVSDLLLLLFATDHKKYDAHCMLYNAFSSDCTYSNEIDANMHSTTLKTPGNLTVFRFMR